MADKVLQLYTPHEVQRAFHQSRARFRVAALGRQAGKSTMCTNELASKAWTRPGTKYWFISPTYEQAKQQYRRFVGMFSSCWELLLKKNQTELRVKMINGSEVVFKSGEVFDNLRGETLHGVVIDEVRDQPLGLWPLVIRPMLATTKGWAAFVSTTNGFDSFYDLAELARTDQTGTWELFQAPSTANPLFTQAELEQAKAAMTQAQFDQEILAKFVYLTQSNAYFNFGPQNFAERSPFSSNGEISPHMPIVVGMDFNVGQMAWCLGQQRHTDFYWHDEIWIENTNTEEAVRELVGKVKDHKMGVVFTADASANARKTSSSQTDIQIIEGALKAAGIKYENRTPRENPAVKDRVNVMNAKMKAADGSVHFWVHPTKCPRLRRCCERTAWKKGTNFLLDQTTDRTLTHSSDGAGYAIMALSNPFNPSAGVSRVRVR